MPSQVFGSVVQQFRGCCVADVSTHGYHLRGGKNFSLPTSHLRARIGQGFGILSDQPHWPHILPQCATLSCDIPKVSGHPIPPPVQP